MGVTTNPIEFGRLTLKLCLQENAGRNVSSCLNPTLQFFDIKKTSQTFRQIPPMVPQITTFLLNIAGKRQFMLVIQFQETAWQGSSLENFELIISTIEIHSNFPHEKSCIYGLKKRRVIYRKTMIWKWSIIYMFWYVKEFGRDIHPYFYVLYLYIPILMDQYLWTQNLITIISFIIKHLNPRLDSKWSMGADPVESKDQAGKMRPWDFRKKGVD